jgi:hypothetical protein
MTAEDAWALRLRAYERLSLPLHTCPGRKTVVLMRGDDVAIANRQCGAHAPPMPSQSVAGPTHVWGAPCRPGAACSTWTLWWSGCGGAALAPSFLR